jgi:hypothetical protein
MYFSLPFTVGEGERVRGKRVRGKWVEGEVGGGGWRGVEGEVVREVEKKPKGEVETGTSRDETGKGV